MAEARWTTRLSRLALVLALVAIVVAIVGLTLARYDLIPKIAGFSAFLGGGLIALAAVVVGLIGVILNWKYPTASRKAAIVALLLSVPYAGFLASRPMAAGNAPSIHDITTDLANPPAFKRLALRQDNLAGVGTVEAWRTIHARAYGDLKAVTIAKPVAAVLADAERIAREQGWNVAMVDRAAGQLEATASVSFIRFKDDVVVRVVPTSDGKASIVDMRSVSRIGVGDLGVNARRIRAFLKALAAA
jgi:hypothetical protein